MGRRFLLAAALAIPVGGALLLLWSLVLARPVPPGPPDHAVTPVNRRDEHGYTALIGASRNGDVQEIRKLAAAGADPDRQDAAVNAWTPLLHAVHKDQLAGVRALLAAGADVNRPAPNGLTPLMLAAAQGNAEIVRTLLAAGADPRARKGEMSVLSHAVLGGNPDVVAALRQAAPDLQLGNGWRDRVIQGWDRLRGRSALLTRIDEARRSF